MNERFRLEDWEWPLLEAAIRLGDWILREPDLTEAEREAVLNVQAALRKLPEASDLDAEYVVRAVDEALEAWEGTGPAPKAEEWAWGVSFSAGKSGDPPSQSVLEIWSVWNPFPGILVDDLAGMTRELDRTWRSTPGPDSDDLPSKPPLQWSLDNQRDWVETTADLAAFRARRAVVRLEATDLTRRP